jgi:hypothetical protein
MDAVLLEAAKRGYRATRNGRVMGLNGGYLRLYFHGRGGNERRFVFSARTEVADYEPKVVFVHRLVAYQKYGDRIFDPAMRARHLNGNGLDNRYANIAIGTLSDNWYDIPRVARVARAKRAASKLRKLTQGQAAQLRKEHKAGKTYSELCEKYGLAKSTVSYIMNSKTYNRGRSKQ